MKKKKEADLWAVGALTYYYLAGYPPFQVESDSVPVLFKKILALDFKMVGAPWDSVSSEGKNFISKLLVKEPSKRLTVEQIIQDPWLK